MEKAQAFDDLGDRLDIFPLIEQLGNDDIDVNSDVHIPEVSLLAKFLFDQDSHQFNLFRLNG